MDDLESLELLSLVSRVTTELQNHLGINDKTLAEFVIDQHLKCSAFSDFKSSLQALGADFPQSLMESVDRLVLTMHPKYKNKQSSTDKQQKERNTDGDSLNDTERKARVFKGLAVPDSAPQFDDDEYGQPQEKPEDNAKSGAMDDTFAMLESLAGKSKDQNGTSGRRKRSRSPDGDGYERGRSRRERYRSRSRSRSEDRHRDKYSSGKNWTQRDDYKDRRRRKYDDDEEDDYIRPPPAELDDQPILYKIYDGQVTNIKDFGAFVTIQGVKGKCDGLVHVSAMQEGARVNHPSDLVSRGQPVKIKVVSIQGSRIGLSMKEVDQVTGLDLIPQKRVASGANMERLDGTGADDRYGDLGSSVPDRKSVV